MIKFDKDEMQNSTCDFDFAEESTYLRKLGKYEVAEDPINRGLGGLFTNSLRRPLKRISRNFCRFYPAGPIEADSGSPDPSSFLDDDVNDLDEVE